MPTCPPPNLRVVLVTFHPKRDAVASLKQLQTAHGVDASRWSFLRADDTGVVRELSTVLGIKFRLLPGGMINHSSVITYVSPQTELAARMDSLAACEENLFKPLQEAAPVASRR